MAADMTVNLTCVPLVIAISHYIFGDVSDSF